MLKEFLTRGAKKIISSRFLLSEVQNGFQHIMLDKVFENVVVVQLEACSEEAEGG